MIAIAVTVVIAVALFAGILLSVMVETLLFHEGNELLEGVVGIVKTITGAFESKLPVGEHKAEEGVFEFSSAGTKEFGATRAGQINANVIEKTKAACGFEAVHGIGLRGGV